MSVIKLDDLKSYLDVIHDADDVKLQMLLDSAEAEALQYMNRKRFGGECPHLVFYEGTNCYDLVDPEDEVESSEPVQEVAPDVKLGVFLLVQADYQETADDAFKCRRAAEIKLTPHRCRMGP